MLHNLVFLMSTYSIVQVYVGKWPAWRRSALSQAFSSSSPPRRLCDGKNESKSYDLDFNEIFRNC